MKEKFYPFRASEDYLFYYFESCSSGCTIRKIVEFEEIEPGVYNLAFGDVSENGGLNDSIVSNNGDMPKVLATVVQAVLTFLEFSRQMCLFLRKLTRKESALSSSIG